MMPKEVIVVKARRFINPPSQDCLDTKCPVCKIIWKFGGTKSPGEILEECPVCKELEKTH